MYLRAWTARTCLAHFPKVVMLVSVDDMVGRKMFHPKSGSLIIARQTFLGRTFEHRGIKVCRVQMQNVHQILPSIVYGIFLKVVAKAPVAEHLEHGMMICVVSHFLKVVVLSAHTQTLLRVGGTRRLWFACSQYYILKLVHARIGEHQRGVVLYNHRSRRHDEVPL